MNLPRWILAASIVLPLAAGCYQQAGTIAASRLPTGAQVRALAPAERAELALGVRLFFDPRLSRTNRVSCGTCHNPKKGFADGLPVGVGVEGRHGGRNTPNMLVAKHSPFQFWDGRAATLEEQALGPIANPVEMDQDLGALEAELQAIPMYSRLFQDAYGTRVTRGGIAQSIAAFERALEAGPTPYERWQLGDDNALSPAARRGSDVFSRNMCGDCHKGLDFTDNDFHNVGWGLDQPNPDVGRSKVTGDDADFGKFKTPTLRNIAVTGPYFHDGRAKTLEEVIEFYRKGGVPNPNLDDKIQPLNISDEEAADLVTFMKEGFGCDNNLKALAQSTVGADKLGL